MGNTLTNQSGLWWVPWFPYNGDQWWSRNSPSVPTESLHQCLVLQHSLPLLLLLWVPSFGGNPLTTVIGLLGLATTSASHTHHRRMCTSAPTSSSVILWDLYRSNLLWISSDPYEEEFADIGLSDFIIAHKRVARRKLERLELTPFQSSLLSRGVQQRMDDREPKGM